MRKTEKGARLKGPTLDQATFDSLRRRITAASGIYLPADETSRFLLERRLAPRLRLRGLTSFADYESTLDDNELETVLDVVAIHETYFFREKRQLKAFAAHILPELALSSSPLKIWSAGCSTGEEAYTIAMILAEQNLLDRDRSLIIATDLSHRVVEVGMRGVYTASSFRTTSEFFKEKYFSEAGRNLWQANEQLRHSIQFETSNLIKLDGFDCNGHPQAGGGFDVIFCRNVLMYFDEAAVKQTIRAFRSMLNEGGYLLLGHAETLLPLGMGFESVQFERELMYRTED